MDDPKQWFIQALEEDIPLWEKASASVGYLVHYVAGQDQKKQMVDGAETYRARANALRSLIELVRESN